MQSAALRFAALFTIVFVLASVVLVSVLWWATTGALDRQVAAAIRADTVALTERFREAGVAGLREAIGERMALDILNEAIYLLVDQAGTRLAGNLEIWPAIANTEGSFSRARISHDGIPADARFMRSDLPGALRLLVGRDESERLQLRLILTEGVVWSLGAAVLIAVMGAALIRQALERRLEPTYRTAMGIAGGELTHRVPISNRGDEFDRLGLGMNTLLDRIEALMQGVRGVSDAIAHDLRTPIARARNKLEESLATAAGEEEWRAAFDTLDLSELLTDAADVYQAVAEARDQRLETALPATLPMVGDRDLILQAVANLLDNAVKFTPEGGLVQLAASRLNNGMVEIVVTDSGPGLGWEDQLRAGERFFRADQSRNTPGSGLGLSLVRAVAQLHGGTLRLADAHPGAEPPGLAAHVILACGK